MFKESSVDSDYFENMVNTYSDMLLRISYQNLYNKSEAEDVVQDAFLQYIKKRVKFESEEHAKAWLIRITINNCKNRNKLARFRKEVPINDLEFAFTKEEEHVMSELFQLDAKYKNVLYLYYYEGYSLKEIGFILNKSVSTIGCWLQRGRKKLKIELERKDEYE
ncbi:MAG TPA: hypothetical protein DCW90_06680 [Lachnospiraceae bacterium]|nr:RNA polymerase sigma factor [uncultured Lachnoclostridium sp.]HAU85183.1 hypothetical protein [Lachnospiraceae bacterium]